MALAELRALSATSYFRSTAAILPYLGGDSTFTASVLLRELGPTSATQFICGNALGSSGWSFVRTSDSNSGATHNYTFTVFENAVAQTVSFAIPGSVGKMMLFHLAYAGGAPGSLTVYVNGIELITGATSSNAITASLGRFSVGFNFNATTQPNPDMGFVAFGYVNTTFTAQVIADNTAACIKAQEISNGGLTPAWQYLYSVARDSGSGVPSVLRNFGTVLSTSTLDVVGRTSMQLSSPPSFLGDSVRIQSSGGGGNVSGPGASTNNAIVTWNGITGDALLNTLVTVAPGTGNIVTPGTIDGRDISVDGTKLDTIATSATNTPLSAVAPVDVTKAAAAVGVAVTAARSDHKHDITTATAVSITNSTNAEGTATTLARSDHTHAHGNLSGGTLHANAIAAGAAGFMTGADKAKLDGIPSGGGGNVNGPVTSTINALATWGDATGDTLLNSVVTVAPVSGNIATPGTVDGRDISVDGTKLDTIATGATATALSAVAPVNVTKSAAAVGVATTAARSDHKHDVTTAAAVTITDSTNSEGTATSLARSDHTHAHGTRGGGTLHAVATDSVAGFMSAADKTKLDNIPASSTADIYEIYVSAANGNDANSGATPLLAVETLTRAWALIPTFPVAAVVIHFGSGLYTWVDMTTVRQNQNAPIYLYGDGAGQPGDTGFDVVASGVAGGGSTASQINFVSATDNMYAGYTFEFTNGVQVDQRTSIRSNTTTALTLNTRFQGASVGATFQIKQCNVIFAVNQGNNIGAGTGYSQVESPLVLINVRFNGTDYQTSTRISSAHVVMYGVMVDEGGLTCVDSTIHAGTLYTDASDPFGAFGNFEPFQANGDVTYLAQQLSILTDGGGNVWFWEGWGLSCGPLAGEQLPLVMDSGQFTGFIVGAQLTLSPAAKMALIGGSIIDNGQTTSGQIINNGGYLRVFGSLTQRDIVGAITLPQVPFLLTTGAGGKSALQTLQGGYTQLDTLTFETNAASFSVHTSGVGSTFKTTEAIVNIGAMRFIDSATALLQGTVTGGDSLLIDDAKVVFDGPAGQYTTLTMTNAASLTVISTGVFRCSGALSMARDSRMVLASYLDFDSTITLTDSFMTVNKTSALTTADFGTVVTLTNSEVLLAAYPNPMRINNGGGAAGNALILVNSKFTQSGFALTVTGRVSLTNNSSWLATGATGATTCGRITATSDSRVLCNGTGTHVINDATAPSLSLADAAFDYTGTTLSVGTEAAATHVTASDMSKINVVTTGVAAFNGFTTLTDTDAVFASTTTLTLSRTLTLNAANVVFRTVGDVNNNLGRTTTGIIMTNQSSMLQVASTLNSEGGISLTQRSNWIATGASACDSDGINTPALGLSVGSTFDMSAVTALGVFQFDSDGIAGIQVTTNSVAHLKPANLGIIGAPSEAAIYALFGGTVYFTGAVSGFAATGNDLSIEGNSFTAASINSQFTSFPGAPLIVFFATPTQFTQSSSWMMRIS